MARRRQVGRNVADLPSGPGTARGVLGKKEEREGGFSIGTYDQSLIEENMDGLGSENARSHLVKQGLITEANKLTEAGYEHLNNDIVRLERNALDWLKKTFNSVRDEGHNHDDLVGTFWWDPTNKNQLEEIAIGLSERVDMSDASYGTLSRDAWKGVSSFGQLVLGGAINFFDIDSDEIDTLLEAAKKRGKRRS